MRSQLKDDEKNSDFAQGFANQYCEFLTREEAWLVAVKNDQVIRICYENQDQLISENLY